MEENTQQKVMVGVLIGTLVVQTVIFMWLWNPQKFQATVQRTKDALKAWNTKAKGVFTKKDDVDA